MYRYNLTVAPEDGITTEDVTAREWKFGQFFKVLSSDAPCFRKGSTIVEKDVYDQENHVDCKYTINFKTISLFEEIEELAKDDYVWDQARKLLASGSITL